MGRMKLVAAPGNAMSQKAAKICRVSACRKKISRLFYALKLHLGYNVRRNYNAQMFAVKLAGHEKDQESVLFVEYWQ